MLGAGGVQGTGVKRGRVERGGPRCSLFRYQAPQRELVSRHIAAISPTVERGKSRQITTTTTRPPPHIHQHGGACLRRFRGRGSAQGGRGGGGGSGFNCKF